MPTNLRCCDTNQIVKYCPGLHTIRVINNEKRRNNYIESVIYGIFIKEKTLATIEFMGTTYRQWWTINETYVTCKSC